MKDRFFKGPITGRHVLYGMLAFFGVIFAVNAVFVYYARTTWTGLETENAYQKGLSYNDNIRAAGSQHVLGWQVPDIRLAAVGEVQAMFVDRHKQPLNGLTVTAVVRRPVSSAFDQTVALTELGEGKYAGRLPPLSAGQWQVILHARRGMDEFRVEQRVILK